MKQALGIIAALGFSLYIMFLWGRLFVDVLLHPIRAFEFFILPFAAVLSLVWLISRSKRSPTLKAEVAKSVRKKSPAEQLEISINEKGEWSDVAVDTARESFKAKSLSAQVDAVAELRTTSR
jgi:hypothetical protein